MNRFRTKKKVKEVPETSVRPSMESESSYMPNTLKHSKTFRLGRKNTEVEEPKLEIDLSTALPPSDDFRTSLLMSGLSARFSMLREQDDPKSKIGKASDDSVLFPKRQSRLNDFGFQAHGLSDIAEVSSINGSIRPPLTAVSRTDSEKLNDGTGTDNDPEHTGSIMNRGKPGEGNNLFGGRQKIYMGNRTLYENDVSQSAFQKMRREEREREQKRREQEALNSRPDSPPLSEYNRNRETSSTTSSNGLSTTQLSTAATSFTSLPTPTTQAPVTTNAPASSSVERLVTKTRRLYETGLDNHLHEQQFSAMTRVDTLTRQRTIGIHTPPPGQSPTFTQPSVDRWGAQVLGKQSMPNLRAASPPPTGNMLNNFDFGVKTQTADVGSKPFGMADPPLSPPVSEHDEVPVLAASVQPNDKGKATALGTFSKPTQPYDDSKYSQRQIQMQQGRETPPLRKHSPPSAFAPRQQQTGRNRAESYSTYGSGRSRSSSSAQRTYMPERIPESPKTQKLLEKGIDKQKSFFFGADEDPVEIPAELNIKPKASGRPLDLSSVYPPESNIHVERPPESEHPMNRSRPFDQDLQAGVSPLNPSISSSSLQPSPAKSGPPADSPTLGPVSSSTGLSGMVRQHLRSESNSSSIYGGYGGNTTSVYSTRFPIEPMEALPPNEYSSKSNPWDNNDWDDSYYTGNHGQDDVVNGNNDVSPSLSVQSPEVNTAPARPRKQSWEKDIEISHHRDGSTATQREQRDFKNELASRRRRVQENLKSFHENDSRSTSPLPTPDLPKDSLSIKNNALGLLKKPSRGSLMVRTNTLGQSKAMKMLGLGNATINSATSPGMNTTTFVEDNQWKQEEEEMVQGVQKPTTPPGTRAFRQARRDMQREKERQLALRHQQKLETEAGESEWPNSRMENQQRGQQQIQEGAPPSSNSRTRRRTPSRDRKPPPVTYRQRNGHGSQESKYSMATDRSDSRPPSSRDRSESDTSGGRSKSRNGRYRDDLAKAMAEGLSSTSHPGSEDLEVPSTRFLPRSPGNPNYHPSPIPSPMMDSGDRSRSNSRSAAAGYFDSQKFPNIQTGLAVEPGMSPRPSPSAPFVVNPTLPLQTPTAGSGTDNSTTNQPAKRKISINKSDISDPIFVHSTSRVDTVNLPGGASLRNGAFAPPIPPRSRTRGMFGMSKRSDSSDELHSLPAATQSSEEMSTFSEDDSKSKFSKSKLRKSSSEGGNLNARARQIAYGEPSPAMPGAFPSSGSPPQESYGGMF